MRRYKFLTEKDILEAFYRLQDAFLAAKDGDEVRDIVNGLLTEDEKIRIGRRIIIAEGIRSQMTFQDIVQLTNVGYSTIAWVSRHLDRYPKCFELIFTRRRKLEKEYEVKKYVKSGGSTLIFKKKTYSGLKRSEIKR